MASRWGTATRYKVVVVDTSRRVVFAAKLDCNDEQTAKHRAEQMCGEHDVELWEADCLVAIFRSARSAAATGDRAF